MVIKRGRPSLGLVNKAIMWLKLGLVVWIFRIWLVGGIITAGDIHYVFQDALRDSLTLPQAWAGEFRAPFLFSYPQHFLSGFFASLGFSFAVVERLVWFWPAIGVSWMSSVILFRRIFPGNKFWMLAPLVYTTNTYFLMIAGGGQMGVALGYALAPLTIWAWQRLMACHGKELIKVSLVAGGITALQIAGDLRMTYVAILGVGFIFVWQLMVRIRVRREIWGIGGASVIGLCTAALLHAYWILPLIWSGRNPTQDLASVYTSRQAVEFFSFADLPHTFSLLHPNWPENIFGKVSFFRPEFLILSIIVSFSLWGVKELLVRKRKSERIEIEKSFYILCWFGILIIGAILAAGVNSPIGGVYVWLFDNLPGFVMFRDPTKFYLLVALSYAILIPIAIEELSKLLRKWFPELTAMMIFFGLWMLLLLPVWRGEVKGTLATTQVPVEYERWAERLRGEAEFSRTLWLPEKQRFAYVSQNHPYFDGQLVSRESSVSGILSWLNKSETSNWLRRRSVKYVMVPIDTHEEIFLTERKYDENRRQDLITQLDEVPWLVKLTGYEPLSVYQIANIYPRVWTEDETGQVRNVNYVFRSLSEIEVATEARDVGNRLVINENYDSGWRFKVNGSNGNVGKTYDNLLTVDLNQAGKMIIYYQSQQVMNVGTAISIASAILLVISLVVIR